MGDCCLFPWLYVPGNCRLVDSAADRWEVFSRVKRVKLEVEMLMPAEADLNSALLLARITEALESLPEQVKIEKLKCIK